jgi:hypothetical protein
MKKYTIFLFAMVLITFSCKKAPDKLIPEGVFYADSLSIYNPVKLVRGQNLYLPIYSNIPHNEGQNFYDLSAFVAVHNTDLKNSISITKVYYFDNDGNLVKDFLKGEKIVLKALGATNFFIPSSDKSGIGANFIIEWKSDSLVNEPLIESVMVSLTSGQGVSFLSKGKILNEMR